MPKPGEYQKGQMGYLLDARRSMAALEKTCREWCRAFDAGDEAALGDMSTIFSETLADITHALSENTRLQNERPAK